MRRAILSSALAAVVLGTLGQSAPAAAQSDVLLRLRSGSPLGDRFRVDSSSGFVAKGVLGVGIIPFTGAGERLMWHPNRASFRAGSIGSAGTQWDDAYTGYYSWAGGYNTTAMGLASFAMGYQSSAMGSYSTGLGYTANADGTGAVAIGYRSTADADYSVAIGQRASTNGHPGAMVFSDGSTTDSTQASANNQFTVRAAGGYRLFTNATMTTGMQMSAGGSSWVVISDRNRKQDFLAVDGEDMLTRIRALPVSTWRYRDEADRSTLHIGPMAQDWHRAFGFTHDNTTINMSDFDGVNLAAIKALETRTTALQSENAELRARLERLEALLAARPNP
jgi:trimeric autotransporter adhesin